MKTPEHVIRRRENHYKALEALRKPTCKKTGKQIWRALCKVEREAHLLATAYCNGTIQDDQWELAVMRATTKVQKLFGSLPAGFFVNGDPLGGYALKLKADNTPEGMQIDWGHYGLLAAIIE